MGIFGPLLSTILAVVEIKVAPFERRKGCGTHITFPPVTGGKSFGRQIYGLLLFLSWYRLGRKIGLIVSGHPDWIHGEESIAVRHSDFRQGHGVDDGGFLDDAVAIKKKCGERVDFVGSERSRVV